ILNRIKGLAWHACQRRINRRACGSLPLTVVGFMNAIAAVAWVLIGLLTVLQPDGVMAAGSAQNKAAVTATKSAPKDTASSKKSSIRKAELKKAELKKAPAR